jgi:chaperonin cofactor prefoldin
MEDLYEQLKRLEERHVWAVRRLEKLAKPLEHVRMAKGELDELGRDANLNPTLSDLPDQLGAVEDTLEGEMWTIRASITDTELEQDRLRRRLHGQAEEEPWG